MNLTTLRDCCLGSINQNKKEALMPRIFDNKSHLLNDQKYQK